jgi:hypothetical protein
VDFGFVLHGLSLESIRYTFNPAPENSRDLNTGLAQQQLWSRSPPLQTRARLAVGTIAVSVSSRSLFRDPRLRAAVRTIPVLRQNHLPEVRLRQEPLTLGNVQANGESS